MNRPSRPARESATTTRYAGLLLRPVRLSRMWTATLVLLFWCAVASSGQERQALHLAHPSLHLLEALHHLLELRVLLEQPVDVGNAGAAAPGDALSAAAVDDRRLAPLLGCHRPDQRLEAGQLLLLASQLLRQRFLALEERNHVHDLAERPHRAELLELGGEILEGERLVADLLGEGLRLSLVDAGLGLFDQGEHVAHAEDALGEPVGVERLERIRLFSHADERDRAPRDLSHRERGAAAGIAVHLREDDGV